ncbi:MAG: Lipoprotein signal peptidase [Alphaproteobacteria bacterium MarineAlpha5_Bin4]|nr:MAG: Lipoprotein signal peptidase [Alphaproteobacteria bacterium MarineAlpha5_Bin4]
MIKIIIFLILVSIDIISKRIVFNFIDLYNFIPIFFFLDLTHIHNFGVSFGFLSGYVSSWLLVIIGLFVVAFIYYLMVSSKDLLEQWGLFVIISGALANILDRMINGYVIDFIYFNFNNYYWPAFNFADICITIGIIMIIINMVIKFKFNK